MAIGDYEPLEPCPCCGSMVGAEHLSVPKDEDWMTLEEWWDMMLAGNRKGLNGDGNE